VAPNSTCPRQPHTHCLATSRQASVCPCLLSVHRLSHLRSVTVDPMPEGPLWVRPECQLGSMPQGALSPAGR
jgi:hypothetical protein